MPNKLKPIVNRYRMKTMSGSIKIIDSMRLINGNVWNDITAQASCYKPAPLKRMCMKSHSALRYQNVRREVTQVDAYGDLVYFLRQFFIDRGQAIGNIHDP